jgi:hypothetical protein
MLLVQIASGMIASQGALTSPIARLEPMATPTTEPPSTAADVATVGRVAASGGRSRLALAVSPGSLVSVVAGVFLTASLIAALLLCGLFVAPSIGLAAYDPAAPPRRAPIIPPAVPEGAREDWAVWSYVDKINQAWGKDWPLAIEWFEDLDARYPGNPMVYDKLYAAYIEDGRTLQAKGDLEGARRRYEDAAAYDPSRGVAQDFLAELDKLQSTRQ